ncbi:protein DETOXIFICATION 42-like isoform X4 [Rutidosis leptorrhynchoides]|uniref:protein DETOXIFICATION 42-like isoform X4 n=1 Tax=Rutidosis leptorrhynchoides TaxID=125765 RepID=UPI003A99E594
MVADAIVYLKRKIKKMPLWVLFQDTRSAFSKDELNLEIAQIAVPAALALMADPIASLIDTAFIGHLGPVELAAVGVAIAIFNQASKIAIFPLVSVTTSFVAEEDSAATSLSSSSTLNNVELEEASSSNNEDIALLRKPLNMNKMLTNLDQVQDGRRHIASASSALLIGAVLGLIQAFLLIVSAKPLLNYMGIKADSPMLSPAYKYLTLRSLGAPAVLLSLAMQGVFRGFKDTQTPLYAIVVGDLANIVLDPILIFVFKMRVTGAAIAHVFSQYLIAVILLWKLIEQVDLLPPNIKDLQLGRFLKNGLVQPKWLPFRFACRFGWLHLCSPMVWLWLARRFLQERLQGKITIEPKKLRVVYFKFSSRNSSLIHCRHWITFFIGNFHERHQRSASIEFRHPVTQPINSLAFVFDGINYGASDFRYSAFSMVLVALVSVVCLFLLSSYYGFVGIWVALSIFMSLRALAGVWRVGTASGPWSFLNRY